MTSAKGRPACSLLLAIGIAGRAWAGTPPEVPVNKTAQIYSPFNFTFGDSGESLFINGGSVAHVGYTKDGNSIINDVAPTGSCQIARCKIGSIDGPIYA